jgi:hypothetical protein
LGRSTCPKGVALVNRKCAQNSPLRGAVWPGVRNRRGGWSLRGAGPCGGI